MILLLLSLLAVAIVMVVIWINNRREQKKEDTPVIVHVDFLRTELAACAEAEIQRSVAEFRRIAIRALARCGRYEDYFPDQVFERLPLAEFTEKGYLVKVQKFEARKFHPPVQVTIEVPK